VITRTEGGVLNSCHCSRPKNYSDYPSHSGGRKESQETPGWRCAPRGLYGTSRPIAPLPMPTWKKYRWKYCLFGLRLAVDGL